MRDLETEAAIRLIPKLADEIPALFPEDMPIGHALMALSAALGALIVIHAEPDARSALGANLADNLLRQVEIGKDVEL